jgi:hypothetical protein
MATPVVADLRQTAERYLAEGRVAVAVVDGDFVLAVFAGDDEVCNVGHEAQRGWWCSCHRTGECAHRIALQLVTKRAVDLAARPQPSPVEQATPVAPDTERGTEALPVVTESEPDAEAPVEIRMAGTEPEPLETAPYELAPRRRMTPWVILVLILTLVTALALALTLHGNGFPSPIITPSLHTNRSTVPSPPPSATVRQEVRAQFPEGASGSALTLVVTELPSSDPSCLTHTLTGAAAYQSDCRTWPSSLYWFYVVLRNRSAIAVPFSLTKVLVLDRDGLTHAAIDVRPRTGDPQHFLPATAIIGPGKSIAGWLSVKADADFVPARLDYTAGEEVLAIEFVGTHDVTPRG